MTEACITRKIDIYNKEFTSRKTLGLSKDNLALTLANTGIEPPKTVIHWN
jgi:hypothetical protein